MSIGDVLTAQHFASGRRTCWAPYLAAEFDEPYMCELRQHLTREEERHAIFPQPERIFEALDETTLDEVKVVIIGQDPYPTRGQAHGLAFSIESGERSASLWNIFKEVERNTGGTVPDGCNCLTPWARQGVLLLNARLTVREGCSGKGEHGKGWERFTDRIVETVNTQREHVVFMLWGKDARKKGAGIDHNRHGVLECRHPARGTWQPGHFSRANKYLQRHGRDPIDWLDVCRRPSPEEREAAVPLTSADAADEARWDRAFAASRPLLKRLAANAAEERRSGRTEELDPARL